MYSLRRFICQWLNYCIPGYTEDNDPVTERIDSIDRRVTRLERSYWKPRDLLDLR